MLVDDDEIIKVHVHTNNPGSALQEALTYGSFVTVKIENMRLQHTEKVMSEQELQPQIAPRRRNSAWSPSAPVRASPLYFGT